MNEIRFDDRIFRGMVLPMIGVGALLIFWLFVQPWISTDLFTRRVGGPAGMAIGFALMPFFIIFMTYMFVAVAFAVLLPVKYLRHSEGFIGSARRFLLFSDVVLVGMDMMLVSAYIGAVRWNYFSVLNLPMVVPLTFLAVMMTVFFIYWTRTVYRYGEIKFMSWKTARAIGLCILLLMLPFVTLFVYLTAF